MIYLIWAQDKNGVIGKDNQLPWNLPADLKHFKEITTDNIVVMGRKTFESIGKPLPNRINIILTQNKNYRNEDCMVFHTIREVLEYSKDKEVFIIGGASIYYEFLNYANRLYVTYIDETFEGDTYFPKIDLNFWKVVSKEEYQKDVKNCFNYSFYIYERI